jgi:hypothetical protein
MPILCLTLGTKIGGRGGEGRGGGGKGGERCGGGEKGGGRGGLRSGVVVGSARVEVVGVILTGS